MESAPLTDALPRLSGTGSLPSPARRDYPLRHAGKDLLAAKELRAVREKQG
jgi:hypothetical protein